MEFIVNNKKKISASIALKIRDVCYSVWHKRFKISMTIMTLVVIMNLVVDFQFGLFVSVIYIIEISWVLLKDIKRIRKLVYSMDGILVTLYEDTLRIGNELYYYQWINHIAKVEDYIIIFIGKYRKIIEVTDENRQNIKLAVEYIESKKFVLNDGFMLANPEKVGLKTKIKVWKDTTSAGRRVIGFIRDICILLIAANLLRMKIVTLLILIAVALFIYGTLFAVSALASKKKVKKFLRTNIIFTDSHIEWLEKKIEYTKVKKVIQREKYVLVKTDVDSIVMFYSQDYMYPVSRAYEVLQLKCSHFAVFRDLSSRKREKRRKLCGYALVLVWFLLIQITEIIAYPETFAKYEAKFDEKYGIDLRVLESDKITVGYNMDEASNRLLALDTIEEIESILDRFPDEFWDEIRDTTRINFYVCDDIEPNTRAGMKAAGMTSNMRIEINVYIDYGIHNVEETVAHEMSHVMVDIAMNRNLLFNSIEDVVDETEWSRYNPSKFVYGKSVLDYKEYFVTDYAKTNMSEDMAETFKYLIACDDKLPDEYESEYIRNKAKYLIEWIEDNFEGVTEDAYWYKWFK